VTAVDFTPVERVVIAHACEDYASNWYGPQPGFTFSRSDCERYITEGHLSALHDPYRGRHKMAAVWAAVKAHLDAHPEILAAGRLTDEQRAANTAARDRRAQALCDRAVEAFHAGRWDDALDLIDRAELESPALENYGRYRRIVSEHAGRAAAGESGDG
jgi:hypothetical protein